MSYVRVSGSTAYRSGTSGRSGTYTAVSTKAADKGLAKFNENPLSSMPRTPKPKKSKARAKPQKRPENAIFDEDTGKWIVCWYRTTPVYWGEPAPPLDRPTFPREIAP